MAQLHQHSFATSLALHVERVDVHRKTSDRPIDVEHLPDGTTHLLYRLTDAGRGELCVVGPRTRMLVKRAPAVPLVVNVQFRPGAAADVFGINAQELQDNVVLLRDLWGRSADELRDKLVLAPDATVLVDELGCALSARIAPVESAPGSLSRRAVAMLRQRCDRPLTAVAADLGVTTRHLHRVFTEFVGVGPKRYARSLRIQRAIRAARLATSPNWAEVAVGSGYSDQSHLIADFRELTGVTPVGYLRGEHRQPASTVCCYLSSRRPEAAARPRDRRPLAPLD